MRSLRGDCEEIRSIHSYLPALPLNFEAAVAFGSKRALVNGILSPAAPEKGCSAMETASSYESQCIEYEAGPREPRADS